MASYDRPVRGWWGTGKPPSPDSAWSKTGKLPGWMHSPESGKPSTTGRKFIPPVKPSDTTRRMPGTRPMTGTEVRAQARSTGAWITEQRRLALSRAATARGLKPGTTPDRSGLANRKITAPGSVAPKGTRQKHASAARDRVMSIRQARSAVERNTLPGSRTSAIRQQRYMDQLRAEKANKPMPGPIKFRGNPRASSQAPKLSGPRPTGIKVGGGGWSGRGGGTGGSALSIAATMGLDWLQREQAAWDRRANTPAGRAAAARTQAAQARGPQPSRGRIPVR